MFDNYEFTVADRFMRYVQIDTQSDPQSHRHPSSDKQKTLSRLLAEELLAMGLQDAHTDDMVMCMPPFLQTQPKRFL